MEGPCGFGNHTCHDKARCIPSYAKKGYSCECLPGFWGHGEQTNPKQRNNGVYQYGPKVSDISD